MRNGVTDFSHTFKVNPDGTRASSTETQLQPDGSIQTINSGWTYDAEDRLIGESVNVASGPDSLASGFTLPAAYNLYGLNSNGTVAMMWDGAGAYVSPGFAESQAGSGDGIVLLKPTTTAGSAYLADGGNGSDWVLVVSNGSGNRRSRWLSPITSSPPMAWLPPRASPLPPPSTSIPPAPASATVTATT